MNRKGYLHAIEGVIAGLLIVFYVGAMVEAPPPTDWTETSLTKRSGDLLGTLSRTGLLDTAVMKDSPQILTAVMESMSADMEYRMRLQGVPQPTLNVGMLSRLQHITRSGSASSSCPPGVNSVEFGCRSGTIEGVEFVLSDLNNNSVMKYNAVNFDFTGDSEYDDDSPDEGPFRFGDLVDWCPDGTCQGTFQVGYINDTLTLYNVTRFEKLLDQESINANGFNVDAFYTAQEVRDEINVERPADDEVTLPASRFGGVDLEIRWRNNGVQFREHANWEGQPAYYEGDSAGLFGEFYEIKSIEPLRAVPTNEINEDALVAKGIAPGYLEQINKSLKEFLLQDTTLVEISDLSMLEDAAFETGFHGELGLRRPDADLIPAGVSTNVFTDVTPPGSPSEFVENYFYERGIVVPEERFDETPSYYNATFSLAGEEMCANVSKDTDRLSISEGGCTDWDTSVGERIARADNIYRVAAKMPLQLDPMDGYRFDNFLRGRVIGEETVLKVKGWRWNVSEASFNVSLDDGDGADDLEGKPDSECSDPYRTNVSFTMDSGTYAVVATDIKPCDSKYEYINFDFNDNNAVDDSESETPDGFSDEGIHFNGEQIMIEDKAYVPQVGPSGEWVYLQRDLPDEVASAVWERNAYRGDGSYFYMGNTSLGADGRAFLQSVLLRAATRQYTFTPSRVIGDPNVGTTYTEAINNKIYTPYSIDSVWWFK